MLNVGSVLPWVLAGGAVYFGGKLLADELPDINTKVKGILSGSTGTAPATTPAAPTLQPGQRYCNGLIWTQKTDGTWQGEMYCPPGQLCAQFIMSAALPPC